MEMREILVKVRGDRKVLRRRIDAAEAGARIDDNDRCARHSVNGAALDYLGAARLVNLVLANVGQPSLIPSGEEMDLLVEELKIQLTHPEIAE